MKTRKKYKWLHNLTQKVYLTEAYKLMLPEPYLSFETGPVFTGFTLCTKGWQFKLLQAP